MAWDVIVAAILPVVGSVVTVEVTWLVNERSKRGEAEYRRKETRYSALMRAFRGFYQDGKPEDLQAFADEMAQAWLYCPDRVIRAGSSFIDAVKVGNEHPEPIRRAMAAQFVLEMRHDLLKRSDLTAEDYRFVSVQQ